jgi:glycerol-3-phosphate acyltransferase PlsY
VWWNTILEFELNPFALIVALVGGYLIGSAPIATLLRRIRTSGPGHDDRQIAMIMGVGSACKGAAAVILAGLAGGVIPSLAAGGAALLGHLFPVWSRFRGGKGTDTYFGILLATLFPLGVLAIVTWSIVNFFKPRTPLPGLAAICLTPLFCLGLRVGWFFPLALFYAVVQLWRYRHDFRALLRSDRSAIKG